MASIGDGDFDSASEAGCAADDDGAESPMDLVVNETCRLCTKPVEEEKVTYVQKVAYHAQCYNALHCFQRLCMKDKSLAAAAKK